MLQKRPRLLLIDGHFMTYRQYFARGAQQLMTSKGEPTNATFGFARALLDILDKPPEYLAVVFDQGLSGRETAYAEYKAQRKEMEPGMVVQLDRIRQLVEAFNIPILELPGFEADDVIGSVARLAVSMGVQVHILARDHDLLQLVSEHVTVEMPAAKSGDAPQIFDSADRVVDKLGVRPEQIIDYKALVGDSSDNIPGVRGIGEKTAVPLLAQYGTLENLYAHLDEQKGAVRTKLETGRESAILSKRLATIRTDLPVPFDLQRCATTDYDPAKVIALFEELEFSSLLKRLKKLNGLAASPNAAPDEQLGGQPSEQMALFDGPTSAASAETAGTIEAAEPSDGTPAHEVVKTVVVDSEAALAELLSALGGARGIAFDTETDSHEQSSARLVGISLSVDGETGYYIPVGHVPPDAGTLLAGEPPAQLPLERVIAALRPILTDPRLPKYGHNAAFDLNVLRRHGLDVSPIAHDTMIAEWLIKPEGRRRLKEMARTYLGVQMTTIDTLIGKGKTQTTMDRVPIERVAPYAAADAALTYRLVAPTRAALETAGMVALFEQIEMPLLPVSVDMNMTGAMLDLPYLAELSREFAARLDEIRAQIYESVGQTFNIGSPKQLNEILFDKLKLPTKGLRKSSHGWSVDADALELLRPHHPALGLIIDWRTLEKLKSTYVDALPARVDAAGRVHTTYNQIGATTGRLSSENPNLQNIPIRTEEGRRVRKAFIAPPGYLLLGVDYSQIELRILAHYSEDAALLEAFRQGQDIHRATAALVAGVPFDQVTKEQRYFAKRVNFGLLYGMGAARLARESELSPDEAKRFIENYFARLPGVRRYLDESKERARTQGYLETLLGRRRDFSALANPNLPGNERARMEREAVNMPIQGTAADIIKIAMRRLADRLRVEKPQVRMILQVHDELVFEVPEDDIPSTAALAREVMEHAIELRAPLRADASYGKNWAEMEAIP